MVAPEPPVVVPVYFDYASSLCFIAWRIAERLETQLDVVMRWRPLPLTAQYPAWRPGARLPPEVCARVARVAKETEVALRIPPRWLDSRAALEGAIFAEAQGRGRAYHEAIFRAVYEDGADLGDPAVLRCAASAAGLAAEAFDGWLAGGRGAGTLAMLLREARELGIVGYPTFLLGEFPLTGIQPYDTMRLLLARHIVRSRERSDG